MQRKTINYDIDYSGRLTVDPEDYIGLSEDDVRGKLCEEILAIIDPIPESGDIKYLRSEAEKLRVAIESEEQDAEAEERKRQEEEMRAEEDNPDGH